LLVQQPVLEVEPNVGLIFNNYKTFALSIFKFVVTKQTSDVWNQKSLLLLKIKLGQYEYF